MELIRSVTWVDNCVILTIIIGFEVMKESELVFDPNNVSEWCLNKYNRLFDLKPKKNYSVNGFN